MKLPRARERELVLSIIRHEDDCVVFPAETYTRPDGFLAVHRDGLQELLHRRLYRQIRLTNLGRARLERTCTTFGCVNPFHFALRSGLTAGSRTHCANGHAYDEVGVTDSGHCTVCATQRQQRRAREAPSGGELNRAKTHCPHDHPYSAENTYLQRTASGVRRKCRACNRAAVQRYRVAA